MAGRGWGFTMNKQHLSERDICTKFITPAVVQAGWDLQTQIREEVFFTAGRIIVRGKLVTRGKAKLCELCDTHPKCVSRPAARGDNRALEDPDFAGHLDELDRLLASRTAGWPT